MALYMLDTDICSYIIKDRPQQVYQHFAKHDMADICISMVTYAELNYGVEKSSSSKINSDVIAKFVAHLTIVPWDEDAAECYGSVRAVLERRGTPIGAVDMMIAAHAKSLDITLVTNNQKHFNKVAGLKLENWMEN